MSDEENSVEETEAQETETTEVEQTEENSEEKDQEQFDEERAKSDLSKKNRENANLRARLKELKPLADKAKELEDAQKSESEKLTEAKTSAEKKALEAGQEAMRLRVALKKGLTETQAKRLVGESEEELEQDADELLDSFKPKEDDETLEDESTKPKPSRPRERLKSGTAPSAEPDETDPAKLAAAVSRDY